MERNQDKSAFVPVSLAKELSGLINSASVITTHQCNLHGISSVVLYTHSKLRIKVLTAKVLQFSVCNECIVIKINNVQELTISTKRVVNAGIL